MTNCTMFVRIKSIKTKYKGKEVYYSYAYLVRNYWDKEKQGARQKVVLYMGKVVGLEPFRVKKIFERDGYKCKECERQDTLTIDHIVPTSKNGNNDDNNLQVLCERCNKKKGNSIK